MVMRNGDTNPPGAPASHVKHISANVEMFEHKYRELVSRASLKGLTIIIKPKKVMKDYAGMNWIIGRQLGFPIPDYYIYIASDLSWRDRYETLVHELIEVKYMSKNDVYWPEHCRALIKEDEFNGPDDHLPDHWVLDARVMTINGRRRKMLHGRRSTKLSHAAGERTALAGIVSRN